MRNKMLITAVFASFLFMGQTCSSTTDISKIIADVQASTAKVCQFVPTIGTIAAIIAANVVGVQTAADIAAAICKAVAPQPATPRAGPPQVAGVTIEGYFVRP